MKIRVYNKRSSFLWISKHAYATTVDDIVKVKNSGVKSNKDNRFKNIYVDFSLNKYINLNSLNTDKFIRTPIHYQSFNELIDTIKNVSNLRLQNIHLVRKIINSLELYILNYLNNQNIIHSLDNIKDEHMFENINNLNENDYDESSISPNNVITILISLYKLRYRNIRFLKILENYIYSNRNQFKVSQIHLILFIYSYFNRINKSFINSLILIILNNTHLLNSDNILNVFTSLFYLNCKNEKTLNILINYIISNNLNFDINVIIYLLNNLKKLNYSNTCLIEFFHNQIVLKIPLLNAQENQNYIDKYFLKKSIQNVVSMCDDKEIVESLNMSIPDSQKVTTIFSTTEMEKKKTSYNNGWIKQTNNIEHRNVKNNDNSYNINNLYGSLHNKYIIENNYSDYIYEYYNMKDLVDKNKNKINLLLEILIYYNYFKEDILHVLYKYLVDNLKSFDKNDLNEILSNLYFFETPKIDNTINLLKKKLLLNMCHYYIFFYKNCNIVLFLFLKLVLEKNNCFNIFVNQIIINKINEDIIKLDHLQFLNLLTNYKNSTIQKYMCDISLIYYDFFKLVGVMSSENGTQCSRTNVCNIKNSNRYNTTPIENITDKTAIVYISPIISTKNNNNILSHDNKIKEEYNSKIDIYEFNEQNKLHLYDEEYLLKLLHLYIETRYYEGIFLFFKSLFIGIKDLKKFNPYLYYSFRDSCYYLKNEEEKKKNNILIGQNMFKKLNALHIIQIYEYFKCAFETYADFFSKQKMLIDDDKTNSLYYFYLSNRISSNILSEFDEGAKGYVNMYSNANNSDYKHIEKMKNKYMLTNFKINYKSYKNRESEETCKIKKMNNGTSWQYSQKY
ncbi:conserved protein, unknown function, partial [Hepatocystis sp. ex Piliocolobus tephrosceles]